MAAAVAAAAGAGAGAEVMKAVSAFDGVVSTVAGVPSKQGNTDNAEGAKALFREPRGLVLVGGAEKKGGVLFVADTYNGVRGVGADAPHGVWAAASCGKSRVVAVSAVPGSAELAFGTNSTIEMAAPAAAPVSWFNRTPHGAVLCGVPDEGKTVVDQSKVQFFWVTGLAPTSDGHTLYAADSNNNRIRAFDRQKKSVATVAGTAQEFNGSDGQPALQTALQRPEAVAFDRLTVKPDTQLYVGCMATLRRFDLTSGLLTTVCAMNGFVHALAVTPCGVLLVGVTGAIYAVDPRAAAPAPVLVAGKEWKDGGDDNNGAGYADGSAKKEAKMGAVSGLALDAARGCVWFTDADSCTVRKLTLPPQLFVAPAVKSDLPPIAPAPAPAPADAKAAAAAAPAPAPAASA